MLKRILEHRAQFIPVPFYYQYFVSSKNSNMSFQTSIFQLNRKHMHVLKSSQFFQNKPSTVTDQNIAANIFRNYTNILISAVIH